jgi:P22 coat protein - gene protein 5
MANVFTKGTKFAATALELLRRQVKAPGLLTNKYGKADFVGAAGDVLNIKRPTLLRARDKGWRSANAIVVDDLVQSTIQVALTKFPYSAVHLSPEEETLDEVQFVRDIQAPQVQAMLEFFEDAVLDCLGAAAFVYEVDFDPTAGETTSALAKISDPRKVASRARKYFTDAHVPTSGRYWWVGSAVAEAIRDNDKLLDVDTSGIPEALRDGVVTKLSGFIVIEMDGLAETESYFVHETCVALAAVAPVVPTGAKGGGSVTAGGISITQIFDYDSVNAKDRSIVEAFCGAAVVKDPEIDPDTGLIVLSGGNPVMDFFRAIKVNFGTPVSAEGFVWTSAITGAPTGGTFLLLVDGVATAAIAFNATNAVIASALNLLDGVAGVKVTGTTTKTITFTEDVVLTKDVTAFTGGTTPNITLVNVS